MQPAMLGSGGGLARIWNKLVQSIQAVWGWTGPDLEQEIPAYPHQDHLSIFGSLHKLQECRAFHRSCEPCRDLWQRQLSPGVRLSVIVEVRLVRGLNEQKRRTATLTKISHSTTRPYYFYRLCFFVVVVFFLFLFLFFFLGGGNTGLNNC